MSIWIMPNAIKNIKIPPPDPCGEWGDLTEDIALRTQKDYKWEGILDNICTLDVDCNVGRDRPAGAHKHPTGGRLPRSAPNECLYQFVSIVFEYFYTFVTILIPCGCGRLDRCFFFNSRPFDRRVRLCWLKALFEVLGTHVSTALSFCSLYLCPTIWMSVEY